MTKIAPEGYYTAEEAARKLAISTATFHRRIKDGKIPIKKYIPSQMIEGYYDKVLVNELARERRVDLISHSKKPIIFKRVETKQEVEGIVDLCVAIYGLNGTPSFETRLAIWQKNPDVYYVTKRGDFVSGYISLIWFDEDALDVLMKPATRKPSRISPAGTGVYSITGPEHVLPFIEGKPIESLFASIGVIPGLSRRQKQNHAAVLLRGTQDVLVDFALRGMPVHKILATSEQDDGQNLARGLGMEEIEYPGDKLLRYELDLEYSDHPLLKPYKEALQ